MSKLSILQTVRTIQLVTFMISSFHNTTLDTSLYLAHRLARYLEAFVILKAHRVPKVSITLITRDPGIILDAWRNGCAGIARRVASMLFTSATTLVTRGAHVPFSHGRRQLRDDVVMFTVVQGHPLGCGYLPVKHDVVASRTWIHNYPIL